MLRAANAVNIGISVVESCGAENPDTFTIDTSKIREIINADSKNNPIVGHRFHKLHSYGGIANQSDFRR
jgi:hypothetical protein